MLSNIGLTKTPAFQKFDVAKKSTFCPPLDDARKIFTERGVKTGSISNNGNFNLQSNHFTVSLNLENIDGTRLEKKISNEEKLNNLKTERKMAAVAEKYGYSVDATGILNEEEEIIKKMTRSIDADEKKQGKILEKRRQSLSNTIAEHGYKLYYDIPHKKLAVKKDTELMENELYGLYNNKRFVIKPMEIANPNDEIPASAVVSNYNSENI